MDKSRVDHDTVRVGFELPAEVGATAASVCGEFNDWSPEAHPMRRLGSGGFRIEVDLPAGRRWRFRYLLDGRRWENDWGADDYAPNGLGADDSVVDLTDPLEPGGDAPDLTQASPDLTQASPDLTEAEPDVTEDTLDLPDDEDADETTPSEQPAGGPWWWRLFRRSPHPA